MIHLSLWTWSNFQYMELPPGRWYKVCKISLYLTQLSLSLIIATCEIVINIPYLWTIRIQIVSQSSKKTIVDGQLPSHFSLKMVPLRLIFYTLILLFSQVLISYCESTSTQKPEDTTGSKSGATDGASTKVSYSSRSVPH